MGGGFCRHPPPEIQREIDMLDEKQKRILEMWERNMTGSEIANAIGITRNAVMGILDRMRKRGLAEYRLSPEARRKPVRKAVKASVSTELPKAQAKASTQPEPDPDQFVMTVLEDKSIPPHGPVTMMNLHYLSCRYIISDVNGAETLFCGKMKTTGAYCAEHHQLCYVPPAPKKKKSGFKFRS
jgi:hypothetical protein